jgi:hypothetical protein
MHAPLDALSTRPLALRTPKYTKGKLFSNSNVVAARRWPCNACALGAAVRGDTLLLYARRKDGHRTGSCIWAGEYPGQRRGPSSLCSSSRPLCPPFETPLPPASCKHAAPRQCVASRAASIDAPRSHCRRAGVYQRCPPSTTPAAAGHRSRWPGEAFEIWFRVTSALILYKATSCHIWSRGWRRQCSYQDWIDVN